MVTKKDLMEALAQQSAEINSNMDRTVKKIKEDILLVIKEENDKMNIKIVELENKVVELEKSLKQNLQYQRSSNVVVSGIPANIEHEQLEGIFRTLFNSVCPHNMNSRDLIA